MVRAALRTARIVESPNIAGVESMADGAREKGDSTNRASDEAALSARLRSLGKRLDQTGSRKPVGTDSGRPVSDPSAMARGFRLSTELVAGVIVGAIIGWLLDRWLGISPWGMIVFLLLGFAAGVLNVMRAAGIAPDRGNGNKH
jgi:ATP synthase protein I